MYFFLHVALLASLLSFIEDNNIWIGMTSRMPADNYIREFHWIDGSTLTFTNWASGQPSLPTDVVIFLMLPLI